jgi:hypothetical protein
MVQYTFQASITLLAENRQWKLYEKRKAEISADQEKVARQKSRESLKADKSAKKATVQNRKPQPSAHRSQTIPHSHPISPRQSNPAI